MNLILQLSRFGCVGAAASIVHLAVVAALVPLGCAPGWANLAAFFIAFEVSYRGHRGWTFRDGSGRHARRRMFLTAAVAFAFNEAAYLFLLGGASMDYRLALAVVLAVQALATFVITRNWVFRRQEG
ncbi:GtrA family protein [Luteolibacter sp. Populi]|uniref:GtrA family protein n=1 Tax=Luteolibacter sp. Populi TaxID=3230487 RepID=UPI0034670744